MINLFVKLTGIGALLIMAPMQIALGVFIFYQFKLLYLTRDKDNFYHIFSFFKVIGAFALIGFLSVTNYWAYAGCIIYLISDALLARNKYNSRKNDAQSIVRTNFGLAINEPIVKLTIPISLAFGLLLMVAISYYRVREGQQQEISTQRYNHAEKTRNQAANRIVTLSERASEFITVATDYMRYTVKVYKAYDNRMFKIERALKIKSDTSKVEVPISLDSARANCQ